MPPENPNPNQIDVQLSLLGQESQAEVQALMQALKEVNASIGEFRNFTASGSHREAGGLAGLIGKGIEKFGPHVRSRNVRSSDDEHADMLDRPGQAASEHSGEVPSTPTSGQPSPSASGPEQSPAEAAREARRKLAEAPTPWYRFDQRYLGRTQPLNPAQLGDALDEGVPSAGDEPTTGPSALPSRPPAPPDEQLPRWGHAWRHMQGQQQEFGAENMPRFGEWQAQDYLRMAARAAGSVAQRRQHGAVDEFGVPLEEQGRIANMAATSSALLGRTAARAPYVHAAYTAIQRTVASETPNLFGIPVPRLDPSANQQLGQRLGGSREGGDLDDIIGFKPFGLDVPLPGPFKYLTEAGRRGLGEEYDRWKMDIQNAGISQERAVEISEATMDRGWLPGSRNNERANVMKNTLADVLGAEDMQAMDTNIAADLYDRTVRHGAASAEQFREMMDELSESAKEAGVDINEMGQHAVESGELFQQLGGTFSEGTKFANAWSQATGTAATVGNQLLQNPMVQTQAAINYGIRPDMIGALPAEAAASTTLDAMRNVEALVGQPLGDKRIPIKADGKTIGYQTLSGKAQNRALAAQYLGLSPETYGDLQDDLEQSQAILNLRGGANQYRSQLAKLERRRMRFGDDSPEGQKAHERIEAMRSSYDTKGNIVQGDLNKLMKEAGFNADEMGEVRGIESIRKRVEKINEIAQTKMESEAPENRTDVNVNISLDPNAEALLDASWATEHYRENIRKRNEGGVAGIFGAPRTKTRNIPKRPPVSGGSPSGGPGWAGSS